MQLNSRSLRSEANSGCACVRFRAPSPTTGLRAPLNPHNPDSHNLWYRKGGQATPTGSRSDQSANNPNNWPLFILSLVSINMSRPFTPAMARLEHGSRGMVFRNVFFESAHERSIHRPCKRTIA